jgi:hypothetical protein
MWAEFIPIGVVRTEKSAKELRKKMGATEDQVRGVAHWSLWGPYQALIPLPACHRCWWGM